MHCIPHAAEAAAGGVRRAQPEPRHAAQHAAFHRYSKKSQIPLIFKRPGLDPVTLPALPGRSHLHCVIFIYVS